MGRRTIVLVVALALAALSAFAVFNYLNSVEDDIRGDIVEVKVFRATQGIPPRHARQSSLGSDRGEHSTQDQHRLRGLNNPLYRPDQPR